jgi:hypothetical protein
LRKIQAESGASSITLKQQATPPSRVMRHQSGLPQMGHGDSADTSHQSVPFDLVRDILWRNFFCFDAEWHLALTCVFRDFKRRATQQFRK